MVDILAVWEGWVLGMVGHRRAARVRATSSRVSRPDSFYGDRPDTVSLIYIFVSKHCVKTVAIAYDSR